VLPVLGVASPGCSGVCGGGIVSREPTISEEGILTVPSAGAGINRSVDIRDTVGDNKPLVSAPAATSITGGNTLRLDEGCHCFFIDALGARILDDRFATTSSSAITCTPWLHISFSSVCTPNDRCVFLAAAMLELRDRICVTVLLPSSSSESISSSTSPS